MKTERKGRVLEKAATPTRNYLIVCSFFCLCFQALSIVMSTSKWYISSITYHKTPGNVKFFDRIASYFFLISFQIAEFTKQPLFDSV